MIQSPPPPPKVVEEKIDNTPLMHTVSFYRRQNEARRTPTRKLVRCEDICSPLSPTEQRSQKQVNIHQQIKVCNSSSLIYENLLAFVFP